MDGLPVKRPFNGVEYEDEGVSMTLRSMRISPLALSYAYDFTCPDPSRMIPGPGTVYIVMKAGSITEVVGGPSRETDLCWSQQATIQAPIDLDEVDYIQFGSQQIKIS